MVGAEVIADRPRKWWLAVLLSLAMPGLGQLYNGQWRKAVVITVARAAALFLVLPLVLGDHFLVWMVLFVTVQAALFLWAAVDAFVVARRLRGSYALAPFNRVAVYLAVLVVLLAGETLAKQGMKDNVVRAFRMPARSMLPTIEVGDFFFVDARPAARHPARGDLIVHRFPPEPDKDFVKRVVALEGDVVELRDKQLYVNGRPAAEPYVIHTDDLVRRPIFDNRDNLAPTTVPGHSYFVMGDNRDNSNDSRYFGPIRRELVRGKPRGIYWSWDQDSTKPRWNRIGKFVR